MCWLVVLHGSVGYVAVAVALNSFVHVFLYAYYFAATLGPGHAWLRKCKVKQLLLLLLFGKVVMQQRHSLAMQVQDEAYVVVVVAWKCGDVVFVVWKGCDASKAQPCLNRCD